MGYFDDSSYSGILSMPDPTSAPSASPAAFGSGDGGAFGSGGIFGGSGKWSIDPQKLAAVMNKPDNGLMGLGAQFLQRGQPQIQPASALTLAPPQQMQMPNLTVSAGQQRTVPATGLLSPYIRMLMSAGR